MLLCALDVNSQWKHMDSLHHLLSRYVLITGVAKHPSKLVGLRMIDPVTFKVLDVSRNNEMIDQIEYSRAFFELFAGT